MPIAVKNGQLDQNFLLDEWICEVQWFNKDLQFILEMEYYQFWSHISFDPNFLDEILFYLQESTPFYLPIRTLTENELMIQLYDKVARNVLAIVCRLITNKESEVIIDFGLTNHIFIIDNIFLVRMDVKTIACRPALQKLYHLHTYAV